MDILSIANHCGLDHNIWPLSPIPNLTQLHDDDEGAHLVFFGKSWVEIDHNEVTEHYTAQYFLPDAEYRYYLPSILITVYWNFWDYIFQSYDDNLGLKGVLCDHTIANLRQRLEKLHKTLSERQKNQVVAFIIAMIEKRIVDHDEIVQQILSRLTVSASDA